MNDKQLEAQVEAIRSAAIQRKEHPLDLVIQFLSVEAAPGQLKRIYGCSSVEQAAGRATHGDAFRY